MLDNLFEPIKIRGMELRNRIVFPAIDTFFLDEGGYVSQQLIDYHVARAKSGCALNIVEAAAVHAPSAPHNYMKFCDDSYLPGYKKLTDAVHQAGGKMCAQLWQGGYSVVRADPNSQIICPSDTEFDAALGSAFKAGKHIVIKGASNELIAEAVKAFGDAAYRAVQAGFDCVEFHAAHGYSPHYFLSGATNHRSDEYGGSLENRARYLIEIIEEMRRRIPDDYPLFMRVVAHDDGEEGGLTPEEVIEFCKMAKAAGVDLLNVSRGGINFASRFTVPPIDVPQGFNVDNAARIRKEVDIPVLAVGRINDPQMAEEIIASGKADLVGMGRAQLADTEFCKKAKEGRLDDIVRCVGCNQGCLGLSVTDQPMSCLRNPSVGSEIEYALKPTKTPKKVAVVGGGMAGMEVAITLKARGHNVVLLEEKDELGGQFLLAGLPPRKIEMRDAAISRAAQTKKAGVDIRLSTKATPNVLNEVAPDEVVFAAGAAPMSLNIPGADLVNVFSYTEVLKGEVTLSGDVVVIGGGLVGIETTEYLIDKNCQVTIVEMLDEIGKDLEMMRRLFIMMNLKDAKVKEMVLAKAKRFTPNAAFVEQDGKEIELSCDAIVIAIGARSNSSEEITEFCATNSIPLHIIGDAKKPRRALDAIAEAAELARAI